MGNLNKADYAVIRNSEKKKRTKKQRPRSAKKLPPIKKEQKPDADMHPEDAHITEWIKQLVED